MRTEELFKKKISDEEVGNEIGGELVNVEDCLEEEGAVYLDFQTQENMVSSDDIEGLKKELIEAFEEHGLVPTFHTVTHLEQGQKIIVRMASVTLAEYDFSEAQKYLNSKVGGPDTVANYCSDALERLWRIHNHCSEYMDNKEREFDEIASTLSICKKVFDKISYKGK